MGFDIFAKEGLVGKVKHFGNLLHATVTMLQFILDVLHGILIYPVEGGTAAALFHY